MRTYIWAGGKSGNLAINKRADGGPQNEKPIITPIPAKYSISLNQLPGPGNEKYCQIYARYADFTSFKVTVQFETEGNGQNEIVGHMNRSEVKL